MDHVSIFNIATVNPPPNTGLTTPRVFYGVQGRIFEDIETGFFAIIHICNILDFSFSDLVSIFNIATVNLKIQKRGAGYPP